jgi:hypothetical protein
MTSRVVDLGREDELVTWHEWLHRCEKVMREALTEEQRATMMFRVTLVDGRSFRVAHSLTHMSRGKCEIGPNRWIDAEEKNGAPKPGQPKGGAKSTPKMTGPRGEPICDVITGYMFIGVGEDAMPTTLAVPPAEIASVECVYVKPETESEPFGFARAMMQDGERAVMEEVEEERLATGD